MVRALALVLACSPVAAIAAGLISRFDAKPPVTDFVTAMKLEDVERCLIDSPKFGLASVYRQPDRLDQVTLVWVLGMQVNMKRVDLLRVPTGTHVRSWAPVDFVTACAPPNH